MPFLKGGDSLFERYRFMARWVLVRERIFCAVRIAISNTWCRLARGKLFIVTLYFTHKLKLRTHFDELHYYHNLTNWDQDWKLKLAKNTFNISNNYSNIEHFYTQPRTFMIHFMIIVMMTSYHYHYSDSLGNNNIEKVFAVLTM